MLQSDLDKAVECLVPAIFFSKSAWHAQRALLANLRAKRASCALREGGGAERRRVSCGRGLGAQPPAGSRGRAPGGGLGGRSPPEIF